MNRLLTELQRLYEPPGLAAREGGLVTADGRVRVAVVGFERAADWNLAARLYEEVQEALELPAPAVSISGGAGYQLWFSFGEPIPIKQAHGFLHLLCNQYLSDMPPGHLGLWPDELVASPAESRPLIFPPALDEKSGKWSAFIDPSLGSMFVEEPGLEMAPNNDRQADLLAGFASIRRQELQSTLERLKPQAEIASGNASSEEIAQPADVALPRSPCGLNLGSGYTDPKSFLLAVMNDPAASAEHRIEAAKALLPYFDSERPH